MYSTLQLKIEFKLRQQGHVRFGVQLVNQGKVESDLRSICMRTAGSGLVA